MRRRPIVSFLAAALLGAAVAAPPAAAAGKLDSATQAVKSYVEQKAGGAGGHAQGAADLVKGNIAKGKTGALGKAGNLLGKDKVDLLQKKKGEP